MRSPMGPHHIHKAAQCWISPRTELSSVLLARPKWCTHRLVHPLYEWHNNCSTVARHGLYALQFCLPEHLQHRLLALGLHLHGEQHELRGRHPLGRYHNLLGCHTPRGAPGARARSNLTALCSSPVACPMITLSDYAHHPAWRIGPRCTSPLVPSFSSTFKASHRDELCISLG